MVKIKKTYRLSEVAIMEIQEIKETFEENGIKLSDSEVIEKALFDLMEKSLFDLYNKPVKRSKDCNNQR